MVVCWNNIEVQKEIMLETDEDGEDEGKSDTYVGKMHSWNMLDVLSVT